MSATFKLIHSALLILPMTCVIIHLHVHRAYHIRTLRHLQTLTKPYNLLTLGKQGQREVKSVILTALCRTGQGTALSWHLAGSGELTVPVGWLTHPVRWLRHPIGWLVLPVPPYVVEVVFRTGKMGQDLQGITVICLNLPIFPLHPYLTQAVVWVLAMQEVSKPWLLSRSINHP